MPTITKYFLRGVLVLIPILITVWVVWVLVERLQPAFQWVGKLVGGDMAQGLQTGFGLLVSIALIILVGVFGSNFVGARLVSMVEKLFDRVPLIKLLHGSIKDLLGAFVGDKKSFDEPVLVALDGDGATKVVGFVTSDDLGFLGVAGSVAVYLPQSYKLAGNLIVVAKDRVEPITAPSSDVMAFLVSGGVSTRAKKDAPAPAEGLDPVAGG